MSSRKSTRVRQKRSLGDDFIDPSNVDPAEFRAKVTRKNSSSPSLPQASNNIPGTSTDQFIGSSDRNDISAIDESNIPTTSDSSSLLQNIADSVSDGILHNIKMEIKEEEFEKEEAERKRLEKLMELVKPRNSYAEYAREIVKKPRRRDSEKEMYLEEATANAVARIREANARKILEKRSMGKLAKANQVACQDAELKNFLSATTNAAIQNNVDPLDAIRDKLAPKRLTENSNICVGHFLKIKMANEAKKRLPPEPPRMMKRVPVVRPRLLTPEPLPEPILGPPIKQIKQEVEEETKPPLIEPPKKVVRFIVTRGPNGEIIPKGRIFVRPPASSTQIRKVVLAPPPGVRPPMVNGQPMARLQYGRKPEPSPVRNPTMEVRPTMTHPGSLADIQQVKMEVKEEEEDLETRNDGPPQYFARGNRPYQFPVIRPKLPPSPLQDHPKKFPPQVVISHEAQKKADIYDMVVKGNRSSSPHRLFLGAEEPIKDIGSYGKLTIRKVKSLSFNQKHTNFKLEKSWNNEDDSELRMKKHQEYIRQQRAKAQKLVTNEIQVWEYIQSGKFKDSLKPGISEFEKMVNKPNPLAEIPQFSDSLSHTNPELFQNLLDIYQMKHGKKFRKEYEIMSEQGPIRLSGPVQIDHPPILARGANHRVLEQGEPELVEVKWMGIRTMVPEMVLCHLCMDVMRLCIRKTYYRGRMKAYPAYRCLRKGCQTFRSIKKQFQHNIQQSYSFNRNLKSYDLKSEEKSNEFHLDYCNESLNDDDSMPGASELLEEKRNLEQLSSEEIEREDEGEDEGEDEREDEGEDEEEGLTVGYEYWNSKEEDEFEDGQEYGGLEEGEELEDVVVVEDPDDYPVEDY